MSEELQPHKRRVRYHGKNPRKFEERYKEHNPDKYAGDVQHILSKGQTPAGMHRPICVEEIVAILEPKPGEVFLDATLGYGGHSQQLMARLLPGGMLFAVDVDGQELARAEARMRGLGFGEDTFVASQMNFSEMRGLLADAGGGFDGILADLGVSSMQLDNPARGFSYKSDGPLDLRLNPEMGRSAAQLLKSLSVDKLESVLLENADEPLAGPIARSIKVGFLPIETTAGLVEAVRVGLRRAGLKLPESDVKKCIQRTFMALRIAVNEEFRVLDRFLQVLPSCLKPGGRVAILSFHSGEDRRVKKSFAWGLEMGIYASVAPTPLRPSAAEQGANPRSSCAKLRWAVRSDKPLRGRG